MRFYFYLLLAHKPYKILAILIRRLRKTFKNYLEPILNLIEDSYALHQRAL